MKQRLLVMNGQRIVQAEQGGTWTNQKVDKAGALKPGFYNLYTAKPADKAQRHDGVIAHIDDNSIYQQVGKNLVVHSKSDFNKVPDIGSIKSISYDEHGKAKVDVVVTVKLAKGRSR
jgi:hypothetical protein